MTRLRHAALDPGYWWTLTFSRVDHSREKVWGGP